jgi:hypothetical protein
MSSSLRTARMFSSSNNECISALTWAATCSDWTYQSVINRALTLLF